MKPLIGITVVSKFAPEDARTRGKLELNWNYAEEVAKSGGVPILIPPVADLEVLAGILDGWLIPGGADIDARHWGEENHPKVDLGDPSRFETEAKLYQLIPKEMPVLGICYGCQFLNVQAGGSLEQHIPDRVSQSDHEGGTMQSYPVDPESQLARLTGTQTIEGKSYHHQAVGRLGDGLKITSRHEDGTVEAIESTDDRWLIGVQWHPERTPGSQATQNLMREFVNACRKFKEARR